MRAGLDGFEHAAVGDRGRVAVTLQHEFGLIDAARDVDRENQQQIDVLVGARERNLRQDQRGERQQTAKSPHHGCTFVHIASRCDRAAMGRAFGDGSPWPAETSRFRPPCVPDDRVNSAAFLRHDAARRESHLDQRAGLGHALDAEDRAIGLGQRLGERQAEAAAGGGPGRTVVATCRNGCRASAISCSLMPMPLSRTRNTTSPSVGERRRYDHLPAGAGELDRVGDQVEHDLADRARVGDHGRQPGRQRGADDDALAIGLRLHDRDALLGEGIERHRRQVELELAGLDLG